MTDPTLPRIVYLALGGTIASVTSGDPRDCGAVPRIAARDLLAGVPAIAQVARVEARQLGMVPSPSLDFDDVQRALD
ncbi:MAG: Asparaginase, N-terminal, partial [Microbacterium sp.]|nr:Asparaginase, N-terminal [Microbacterium sp.]